MNRYLDKIASITPNARRVLCDKATEPPNTGIYNGVVTKGTYLCRRCGIALFRADSQFSAGCGWPSFDEDIPNAVMEVPDRDGQRVEICCHLCASHLGHVFLGEHLTSKNRRYCVNSLAIDYVENNSVLRSGEAIVAGGCFWGIEEQFRKTLGVLNVEVGFSGGIVDSPSYEQVCLGKTKHFEAVRVMFDLAKTNFQTIIQHFFEIHDPTQEHGQGADIGYQYQSAVFYFDELQHQEINEIIDNLRIAGLNILTRVLPVSVFWRAEDYHQCYYLKQQT